MIRAIVVDDQKSFLKMFQGMIQEHFENRVELVSSCTNIREAIHAIRTYRPELIFLDIEFGEESGFDLLEKLPVKNFDIIFTTAHEHYAIKAIRFSAIDYLLKPFGPEDLQNALDRYEICKGTQRMLQQLDVLNQNLKTISDPYKKIALPTTHGFEVVPLNEIIHLCSSSNYTLFYLEDGREFVVTHSLREYEEILDEYNFFRLHQSHMVNMDHVKSFSRIDGGKVLLSNGQEIEVSRRKKDDFIRRLNQVIR